jgi:hypothetical protein
LAGLDSSDITSDTATNDDQIVLSCCKPGEAGKVSLSQNPGSADISLRSLLNNIQISNSPASEA